MSQNSSWSRDLILALVIFSSLLSLGGCSSPEEVEVSVLAPVTVPQGRRFEIHARATNLGVEPQYLVDLDVADEYLEGVVIESATPRFTDAFHVPLDNTISYSFDLPIEPGGDVLVVFEAYAAKVGDFSGEIDFCVNSEVVCISYPVRTIIE